MTDDCIVTDDRDWRFLLSTMLYSLILHCTFDCLKFSETIVRRTNAKEEVLDLVVYDRRQRMSDYKICHIKS